MSRLLRISRRCAKSKSSTFSCLRSIFDGVSFVAANSEFGLAFLDAKERCNARTRHGTFETSVIEIAKDDLKVFIETLCEGLST